VTRASEGLGLLMLLLASCRAPTPDPSAAGPDASTGVDADAPALRLDVHSAARCGECHASIARDWRTSAHARAARSTRYQGERSAAIGSERCDDCHTPMAGLPGVPPSVVSEGIGCEICHAIEGVDTRGPRPRLVLQLGDGHKLGARCDGQASYFHAVRCSPLHGTSTLCEGCHQLREPRADGTSLPVLTEVEDWRASGAATECQHCHMRGTTQHVTVGQPIKDAVAAHHFLGRYDDPEATGLVITSHGTTTASAVTLTLEVLNDGADHALPAGIPGRRLVLHVDSLAGEEVLASDERVYTRRVVDSAGLEVPFYEAVRELDDTRLYPSRPRSERLRLPARPGGRLRVRLWHEPAARTVVERFGLPPADAPLLDEQLDLPARPGPLPRRVHHPRQTVEATP
jgi:hypothetical protein